MPVLHHEGLEIKHLLVKIVIILVTGILSGEIETKSTCILKNCSKGWFHPHVTHVNMVTDPGHEKKRTKKHGPFTPAVSTQPPLTDKKKTGHETIAVRSSSPLPPSRKGHDPRRSNPSAAKFVFVDFLGGKKSAQQKSSLFFWLKKNMMFLICSFTRLRPKYVEMLEVSSSLSHTRVMSTKPWMELQFAIWSQDCASTSYVARLA